LHRGRLFRDGVPPVWLGIPDRSCAVAGAHHDAGNRVRTGLYAGGKRIRTAGPTQSQHNRATAPMSPSVSSAAARRRRTAPLRHIAIRPIVAAERQRAQFHDKEKAPSLCSSVDIKPAFSEEFGRSRSTRRRSRQQGNSRTGDRDLFPARTNPGFCETQIRTAHAVPG
jgi:hypothetical protein